MIVEVEPRTGEPPPFRFAGREVDRVQNEASLATSTESLRLGVGEAGLESARFRLFDAIGVFLGRAGAPRPPRASARRPSGCRPTSPLPLRFLARANFRRCLTGSGTCPVRATPSLPTINRHGTSRGVPVDDSETERIATSGDLLLEHGSIRLGNSRRAVRVVLRGPQHEGQRLSTRLFAVTSHGTLDADWSARRESVRSVAKSLEAALEGALQGIDQLPRMFALVLLHARLAGVSNAAILQRVGNAAAVAGGTATWRDVSYCESFGRVGGRSAEEDVAYRLHYLGDDALPLGEAGRQVLINGPGRSGTRWLLEAVARLSAHAGATWLLPGPVWRDVPATLKHRNEWNESVAACNLYFAPGDATAVRDAIGRWPMVRTLRLACPRDMTLVAKSESARSLPSWLHTFPAAKVVFIERDPRNIVLSRRQFFRDEKKGPMQTLNELAHLAVEILNNRRRAKRRGNLVVRYEDMIVDLRRQIRRLSDFLGLQSSEAVLDSVVPELTFDAMAGRTFGELRNGDYFRGGSDWTRELTRVQRAALAAFDPVAVALGYPPATISMRGRAPQAR